MDEQSLPFISVIIPHYNDLDHLKQCIEHVRRQTWPRSSFEIIVADNNSLERVAAEVRSLPDIQFVPAPVQGAGPARNAGASAARGDIFAFLDSDCFAIETWLEEGVSALRHFDYVGGELVITPENARRVTPAEGYDVIFGFDCERYIRVNKFTSTGNLFVPRAMFEKVGGFRSDVSEDMEWCWRANALGFRLGYAAKAVVHHPARSEWRELTRKWDRVVKETIHLDRERNGPHWRWRWLVRTALTALSPLLHAPKVIFSSRLAGVSSKVAGLAGLLAIRLYRARRMIVSMNDLESPR